MFKNKIEIKNVCRTKKCEKPLKSFEVRFCNRCKCENEISANAFKEMHEKNRLRFDVF